MTNEKILITGCSGLIGTALLQRLSEKSLAWSGVDLNSPTPELRVDVRDAARLAPLLDNVTGIVHLAAVSRVIHGQRDPELCRSVNVDGTATILELALRARHKPWVVYASSREVYGRQEHQPVMEDAPLLPVNAYARSKVEAERLVGEARAAGLRTAILRFSSVYGSLNDHHDRVVPAFITGAVDAGVLRVDGNGCSFDLTHVDDVARGVLRVIDLLMAGEQTLPPVHFVGGNGITLLELARLINGIVGDRGRLVESDPRSFDVHHFVGHPGRASALLGWRAATPLSAGLTRLTGDYSMQRRWATCASAS